MERYSRNALAWLHQHPLVLVCVACCCGVFADRNLQCGAYWFAASVLLLFLTSFAIRRRSRWSTLFLWLSVLAAMGFWHHRQWRMVPDQHVVLQSTELEPRPITVRGRLIDSPTSGPLPKKDSSESSLSTLPRSVRSKFHLQVTHVRDERQWIGSTGKVAVQVAGHMLGVAAGDEVQVFGSIFRPPPPMNPGQFAHAESDRASRLFCRMEVAYPDCVIPWERDSKPSWLSIYTFRSAVAQVRNEGLLLLDQFVGQPRDVLAGALLLGARDRLDRERIDYFFHTGTIHLLAISGLHLGILTWCFFFAAKSFRQRKAVLLFLMVFSLAYCFLTGVRDPVLRAAILVHVVCVGMIWRRKISPYNALAAAAILVLLLRPASLFLAGTQLSFLAVAAMIWIGLSFISPDKTAIESLIERTRTWYQRAWINTSQWFWQLACVGVVIWIVALPLVMLHFHLVSPVALVLNVLLTIPIVVSLLSGFVVMVTGKLLSSVAGLSGVICDRGLGFVEGVVQWSHELPGAFFWTAGPTAWWCAAFYVGLLIASVVPRIRRQRYWLLVWLLMWLAMPVAAKATTRAFVERGNLRCTFLAVGHGTCVVLELPDDRVVVYDCGRMGVPPSGVRLVSSFLWHRRITHIDGVILSHADADHYNLLPGLLERFSVGEVFVSLVMFTSESPGTSALRAAIDTAGVPIPELQADDVLRFGAAQTKAGEAELHVLHPLAEGVRGSDNANSIVVEVRYEGRTILLPGDLESPGTIDVISEANRDCDVLMAPHHGSLSPLSAPQDVMAWCSPEWVVISSGATQEEIVDQKQAYASNGSTNQIMHTAEVGAVTVQIEDGELHVEGFRDEREKAAASSDIQARRASE